MSRFVDGSRPPWFFQVRPKQEPPSLLFVGGFGEGKGLRMTWHALAQMRSRLVFANWQVTDPFTGDVSGHIGSWQDFFFAVTSPLLEPWPVTILLDEANTSLRARDFSKLHPHVQAAWDTHRHYGCEICFSVQHEADIDTAMRRKVQLIVLCTKGPAWTRRLRLPLFGATYCRPHELDALRGDVVGLKHYDWVPPWVMTHAYDTHAKVEPWPMPESAADLLRLPLTLTLPSYALEMVPELADSGLRVADRLSELVRY